MAKKKKQPNSKKPDWAEAKRRCRLSDVEILMAKELGMGPKSLVKNIPSQGQKWKEPVRDWIRNLYSKKFGDRTPGGTSQ